MKACHINNSFSFTAAVYGNQK